MARINREEYEKIKSLPDYDWNWIAREKTGKILSFANKPTKTDEVWEDKQTRLWFNHKDSQLFQFIQWEDEEPYNIQDLIDGYEIKELQLAPSGTVIVDPFDESEETEVKNIEWLREQIKNEMNGWGGGNPDYFRGAEDAYEDVKDWLNQLDEPEVLSWEWIDDHINYADVRGGTQAFINVSDLQNLLVPKQEEVDQAYKDGYEQGKEHATEKQTEETETVAKVLVDYLIASAKLKLALSMEVEELEQ